MRVTFVCVGRLKEQYWRDACAEYLKRLGRFCKAEVRELPERADPAAEADEILRACRGTVIALAVEGRETSSEAFAAEMKAYADRGAELTFVVGSSCGLDARVKARADALVSFSKMTFPHQLFRVVLLEQFYRACMINAGAEYHK